MAIENLTTFGVGCIGAVAPEIVRLYNLRLKSSVFRWSWSYLLFSIPFILLGGFMAWLVEPSSPYAAFYAGVSTPVLISSIAKNAGVTTTEPPASPPPPSLPSPPAPRPSGSETSNSEAIERSRKGKGGIDWNDATTRSNTDRPFSSTIPARPLPTRNRQPSLFKQFLSAL